MLSNTQLAPFKMPNTRPEGSEPAGHPVHGNSDMSMAVYASISKTWENVHRQLKGVKTESGHMTRATAHFSENPEMLKELNEE